ncbi:uncharacterized protein C7orf31 isoform X2 [Kryptolebias marmoratus]|uniref:uncharacterized protein C7orf31 isoform X2 n=1 Tax=Kryptolebias marmoratus TaxID=37003 RepID=UPI000D52FC5D|nr:uncharacterized protein C7orf31 isoform X2 [Kryptolebias marmoratus]
MMPVGVKGHSCHMELKSSATRSSSDGLNGRFHWGYGGTIPEHVTSQQSYKSTGRKQSNDRLNDQLIPKPTDVNVAEKGTQSPAVKEHPYSSHISRFAMFPSFCSPDDPERGVRAALRPFPNHHVPNRAPEVIVLCKTIGGPYRHEISGTPGSSGKKAVTWTGENGRPDEKPLQGGRHVVYPAPTKTVLPNARLQDWDGTLPERTSNMLKNLERSLWVTSYQIHYTGSGPANPLKIDDFKEKISNSFRLNSHSAPLRERSYPVFVPSKPKEGRRQWSKVHFDEALMRINESRSSKDTAAAQISHSEQRLDTIDQPNTELVELREKNPPRNLKVGNPLSGCQSAAPEGQPSFLSGDEGQTEVRELLRSVSSSSILPRPAVLPGIPPPGAAPSLLELQHSFSKSEAQKRFNSSVSQAVVNLRHNGAGEKKHNFFGINCNYIHG